MYQLRPKTLSNGERPYDGKVLIIARRLTSLVSPNIVDKINYLRNDVRWGTQTLAFEDGGIVNLDGKNIKRAEKTTVKSPICSPPTNQHLKK